MFWRLIKTAIFSVLAPGTVGFLIPYSLRNSSQERHPFPLIQTGLGLLFFALGTSVYLWCAWDFVAKGLGTPAPIDAPRLLVVRGLYRFTRNPMYVGVAAMIAGQAVYYGSLAVVFYLGIVVTAFNLFVLLYEEPVLKSKFGAQYEEYCRAVPRWFLRSRRT